MNAVLAPTPELRVNLEPTRTHSRLLVVTRKDDYVHASLLIRARKTHQSLSWAATCDPKRVWMRAYDCQWWLHIGDGSFAVSEAEANRLRDELQIEVRS